MTLSAPNSNTKFTVAVCESQPVTADGIRMLLASCADFVFLAASSSLSDGVEMVRKFGPDLLIVDKALGMQAVLDWIADLKMSRSTTVVVVWGVSVTEAEALRFLQAGAKGIIRKSTERPPMLACLRTVAAGRNWMEDAVFRDSSRGGCPRSDLTPREHQVMELVEHGLKNREIAHQLGIRPGTVKIHLKHIFEKTGVRGRYGLALTGLKEKGMLAVPETVSS